MSFATVYPLYVAKAEKKGRTKAEVDEVISWLTGYRNYGDIIPIERALGALGPGRAYATLSASSFRITSGSRSIASKSARAGASGVLRCCSQSRNVVIGR
jgi:ATP-dependent protease HslVU (ClpYQ) peptidase subunit